MLEKLGATIVNRLKIQQASAHRYASKKLRAQEKAGIGMPFMVAAHTTRRHEA
jgi:hypothetical protein